MDKTFLALCSRYEDIAPAEIPAAAMKVADAACAQLQTVHDTVPAGEQTAAAKEIITAVSGVKKALLERVEQFHDELNPNVLSAFHDACAQYAGAACGMMHIVGNKVDQTLDQRVILLLSFHEAPQMYIHSSHNVDGRLWSCPIPPFPL